MSVTPPVTPSRAFDAYQSFVLATKLYWTHTLYPELKHEYTRRAANAASPPTSAEDVNELFEDDLEYAFFAWFERHLQQMKYSGQHGLVPHHDVSRAELEAWLNAPLPEGLLSLDPDFEAPEYFTRVDIHQHPGGVCGDSLAGVVYERGARSTTPLLSRDLDLHHRFVDEVRTHHTPRRIIDLGCGFGKSTQPFCTELPDAEILGIDLSVPCLKLAAVTAALSQTHNVRFRQGRAEATGEPDGCTDLVTSTMMLHEMPPRAIREVAKESYRLLEPDGWAIHLDFLADDDPFARFIHYGHARRNNEPYMRPLNEMDLMSLHEEVGFSHFEIRSFEEFPGACAPENIGWRFPWVVVAARK